MIVGGVWVGAGVKVGGEVGEAPRVGEGVKVGRGVREGPGVLEGIGVRVGVRVGGRTLVGVARTSSGYNSNIAECQSIPAVIANSVNRAPLKKLRQFGKDGNRSQPYAEARRVRSTQ